MLAAFMFVHLPVTSQFVAKIKQVQVYFSSHFTLFFAGKHSIVFDVY